MCVSECVFVEYCIVFHNNHSSYFIIIASSFISSIISMCVCAYCSFVCKKKNSSNLYEKHFYYNSYTISICIDVSVYVFLYMNMKEFLLRRQKPFFIIFFSPIFVCELTQSIKSHDLVSSVSGLTKEISFLRKKKRKQNRRRFKFCLQLRSHLPFFCCCRCCCNIQHILLVN